MHDSIERSFGWFDEKNRTNWILFLFFFLLKKTEDDDSSTSDPIFGMKPNKPKDFQIFYNLVDFCQWQNLKTKEIKGKNLIFISFRDLLLEQSADLFEKWIFRFLYDVISASTKWKFSKCSVTWKEKTVFLFRYPLVSGFYRLATFVMKICLKMNYFQVKKAFCSCVSKWKEEKYDFSVGPKSHDDSQRHWNDGNRCQRSGTSERRLRVGSTFCARSFSATKTISRRFVNFLSSICDFITGRVHRLWFCRLSKRDSSWKEQNGKVFALMKIFLLSVIVEHRFNLFTVGRTDDRKSRTLGSIEFVEFIGFLRWNFTESRRFSSSVERSNRRR